MEITSLISNKRSSLVGSKQSSDTCAKDEFSTILSKTQETGASQVRNSSVMSMQNQNKSDATNDKSTSQVGSSVKESLNKEKLQNESSKNEPLEDEAIKNESLQDNTNLSVSDLDQSEDSLDTIIDSIKESLLDKLNISEEELEEIMAQLGLTSMDLLQVQTITEIVLAQFGANDASEVLFDEELATTLKECIEQFQEETAELSEDILKQIDAMSKEKAPFTEDALIEEGQLQTGKLELSQNQEESVTSGKSIDSTTAEQTKVEIVSDQSNTSNPQSNSGQEGFMNYFTQQVDAVSITSANSGESRITTSEIINQIVEQIKVNLSASNSSMELLLNPESLGKVHVVVSNKDGMLTAQIKVENQIVKEAVETSLNTLKESFVAQGLKVEEVEVAIGNYSSEYDEQKQSDQEQDAKQGKKKFKFDSADEYEHGYEDANTEQQPININGTVTYSA